MLTLLLNPTVRKITIGAGAAVAILVAYSMWSAHMRRIGADAEKAREQAVAIQHDQEVTSKATTIDQDVAKDPAPQDTLRKEWSQP